MNEFPANKQNYNPTQPWPPQAREGGWGSLQAQTAAEATVAERMSFVRKVYALFFAATLFAIGGVALGFLFPEILMRPVVEHPYITLFVLLGGVMGAQAVRHVAGVNLLALFGFTTLTGIIISPLMAMVAATNPASIWQAGILTVGIFGGLTAYVFISKKDFSFLRGMVTTGLIIVCLASLLNFFIVGSSALMFAVSIAALFLFSGFVLYDTSNIIRRYPTNEYIAGALDLYLDAFNIFLALIRILNAGRR
ncbi:MAG TPA: Bax inhibitor-1/YccA family protein [Pyrinomonadaceae bacterium]|jgi:FtsH-binding integral membrane protein|nr:Bax inhibitor-1/YccA family protein [Pyrinomonadaceae bacterium]